MKIKSLILGLTLSSIALGVQAQDGLKIGFTNVEYVLSLMPEAKQADSEYKAFEKQLQNQLQAKGTELQTKIQEYQQTSATMTDIVKADKEAELQSLNQRFETFQKDAQASLQKKQSESRQSLYKKETIYGVCQKASRRIEEEESF